MATMHSRGTRPGAMTMAMRAARGVDAQKVLRVGVLRGARVLDERLLLDRGAVTVGTSEHSTFTVAASQLPARFELFSVAHGRYTLRFTAAMEGRIALPDGLLTLSQLREQGRAQRDAATDTFTLPITDSTRGKIALGDVTFLFQFVNPPPPAPRPQLPVAIRSSAVKNVDWSFNACLAGFLALALTGVGYVEYGYDPEVDLVLTEYETLHIDLTPPSVEHVEPSPTEAGDAPAPPLSDDHAPSAPAAHRDAPRASGAHNPAHAAPDPTRGAEIALEQSRRIGDATMRALSSSAEFMAITGAINTGRSATDALRNGGIMSGTLASLENTGGVVAATANNGGLHRALAANGAPNGELGLARRVQSRGDGMNTGDATTVHERVLSGAVHLGAIDEPQGEGDLAPDAVAAVIRRNVSAIRWCYNEGLREHPALAGRLELHFTIGESGRIAGTPTTSGLAADPGVGQCVASRVRGWVFPQPQGGSVSFSFPFNFAPGE